MARLRKGNVVQTSDVSIHDSSPTRPKTTRGIVEIIRVLVKRLVLFLLFAYCVALFLVYVSYSLRHQLVYLNYLVSPFVNYSDPESRGISNTNNFYIQGQDGRLGVWHVKAEGSSELDDGKPIVLYMHGNAYSRNAKHRIGLYKVLSSLGCHVVALDYRGYGDSDGYPTEQGLIDDSLTTFNWVKVNANRSPIFLWGHSLGAAVGIGVAKLLTEKGVSVMGLILEAPFNNMREAAIGHPLALPFRFMPNFSYFLREINDLFKSDEKITSVGYPTLILHDHDDNIIKFALGQRLYKVALNSQDRNQYLEFKEFRGYGHRLLYNAKNLPEILRKFMNLKSDGMR